MMSVALPGVNGTIARTGLDGQPCAAAMPWIAIKTAGANHLQAAVIVDLLVVLFQG
jgi:hypothetical protein